MNLGGGQSPEDALQLCNLNSGTDFLVASEGAPREQ